MFLKVLGFSSDKTSGNMMAVFSPAFGCCGDAGQKVVACQYMLSIDTGAVATVDDVTIAGVTYPFDAVYATTTEDGRNAITANIKKIMKALGYSEGTLHWVVVGAQAKLYVDYSPLSFDNLGAAGNQFVPIQCLVFGWVNSENSGFAVQSKKLANGTYDVTIKIYAGSAIEAFEVTYDAAVLTSVVPAGNSYTFNAAALDAEAEKALIVDITVGSTQRVVTLTEKLSNYRFLGL